MVRASSPAGSHTRSIWLRRGTFISGFARSKAPQWRGRNHGWVIELPDVFAAALALLTFAVFAALVWAGNHQH
jgi:hypothetical protein